MGNPGGLQVGSSGRPGRQYRWTPGGRSRWTPLSVDTGRSCWTNALEFLAAVIFDLVAVDGFFDVLAVFELARNAHQKYLPMSDLSWIFAIV